MAKNTDIDNIDIQKVERIVSYLRGEMSHEEELKFMNELQANPELREDAISLARLSKGMKDVGEANDKSLKEAFLSVDEEVVGDIAKRVIEKSQSKDMTKTKVISFRKRYVSILSLAASVLFIVYFGLQYNDYRHTTLLGEQFATEYESSIMRGDKPSEAEKEIEVLVGNVYYNKELSYTVKRLAVLWEVSTLDTYNDYTDYASNIGWALATGYLKDNNKDDASTVLAKMGKIYDVDTAVGKRVRELQSKIINL